MSAVSLYPTTRLIWGPAGGRTPVVLGEDSCLCDVKEFAASTYSIPGSGSWPMTTVLKPLRSKVHEGTRQLRPAAELGHALTVALTNPRTTLR